MEIGTVFIYQFLTGNDFMKRVEEDSEAVCQITSCVVIVDMQCKKGGVKEGRSPVPCLSYDLMCRVACGAKATSSLSPGLCRIKTEAYVFS